MEQREKTEQKVHGYVLLRLNETMTNALDELAAVFGTSRAALVKMIVVNYIAQLQRRAEPYPFLLYAPVQPAPPVLITKAPARLPAGASAEQGEPTPGDEPGLLKEAEAGGEGG